jgi:hypothetical protein
MSYKYPANINGVTRYAKYENVLGTLKQSKLEQNKSV